MNGSRLQANFLVRQACPVCGGSGSVVINPCRNCRGSGRTKGKNRLTLRIPAGVETGSRLRLAGKGEGGSFGGPPGDLYVVLKVRDHDLFERRGDDLFCEVPVPFELAALGGEVEVPTIDGYALLKLSPGTENGKIFRLRDKGIPNVEGHGRGDLHVRIAVEVPSRLSGEQKRLLKEYHDLADPSGYPHAQLLRKRVEALLERRKAMGK